MKFLKVLSLATCFILCACGKDVTFGAPDYGEEKKTEEKEESDEVITSELFKNGETIDGVTYVTYRIPTLVRTKNKLFAFCEARTVDADRGDIDIAYRVSIDGGKTWGNKTVLFSDNDHTVGNPCCVYTSSGRLVMVFNWHVKTGSVGTSEFPTRLGVTLAQKGAHPRRVFVTWSDDEGDTWTVPKDITDAVMEKSWTWNAAGPCHGIQLQVSNKGRIIIPCDMKGKAGAEREDLASYVIYSDDNGETWAKSDIITYGNESCAVERSDGKIHLDMRNSNSAFYTDGLSCRAWSLSSDGGQTWTGYNYDEGRPEPTPASGGTKGCQGSIINYNTDGVPSSKIIFANPASKTKREKMTLRFSSNNGVNWQNSFQIDGKLAGYSDLVVMKDGAVGLFYETGAASYHDKLVFTVFPESVIKEYFK